jgi:hypothetical protein
MSENPLEELSVEGQELLQICFGLHQLILHFDDGLSISTESGVHLITGDRSIEILPPAGNAAELLGLLGGKIRKLSMNSNSRTQIAFRDGRVLEFRGEDDGNESYEISMGTRNFVV